MRYALAFLVIAVLLAGCYGDKPLDNPLDPEGAIFKSGDCDKELCSSHGVCEKQQGVVACVCGIGYEGAFCEECATGYVKIGKECIDGEKCSMDFCSGQGVCLDGTDAVECLCRRGYAGANCSECSQGFIPVDNECRELSCSPASCGGHGHCDDTGGFVICDCYEGYKGTDCEKCDTGYKKSDDVCVENCGDGLTVGAEECDRGGDNGDCSTCTGLCKIKPENFCGDGFKCGDERCDDGENNGQYGYCLSDCEGYAPYCGNKNIDHPYELCDGNTALCSDISPILYTGGDAACDPSCAGWNRVNCEGVDRVTKQWGTSLGDWGFSIAVDSAGNIFVTGVFAMVQASSTTFLTKWSADGTNVWTQQHWGASFFARSLALDSYGNIFVVGFVLSENQDANNNIFLTKLNADGAEAWTKQWGTSGNDYGNSVAVDSTGNIYVTGSAEGSLDGNMSMGKADIFLTKWDANGTKAWTRQWGRNGDDVASSVAIDKQGNIYATGFSTRDGDSAPSFFVIKWDIDGTEVWQIWSDQLDGPHQGRGLSVALDANNNIFLMASIYNSDTDTSLIKLSSGGEKVWAKHWKAYTNGVAYAHGPVAINQLTGDVFAAGKMISSGGTEVDGFFLTKFNNDGMNVWTKQWSPISSTSNFYDDITGVAIDRSGTVYVTGGVAGVLDGNTTAGETDVFFSVMSGE